MLRVARTANCLLTVAVLHTMKTRATATYRHFLFQSPVLSNLSKPLSFISQQYRFQSSSASTSEVVDHQMLFKCIQEELAEEQASKDKPTFPAVPEGWTIRHVDGEQIWSMVKTHRETNSDIKQTLTITCSCCHNQNAAQVVGEGEDDAQTAEDGSYDAEMELVLTNDKNSEAIIFDLSVAQDELVISGMAHAKNYVKDAEDFQSKDRAARTYPGPLLSELSENLVQAIVAYLADRGIGDNTAVFVSKYSRALEQKEYEGWLDNIGKFCK